MASLLDPTTGLEIRPDSSYSQEGKWVLWRCEADDGIQHTLVPEGNDPEYTLSATGQSFRSCMIEGEHEPQEMGQFEGRWLDALRWRNRTLGWEEFQPAPTEFITAKE